MENRLSYVRWQMDNILSDPAIKVSILGKGAEGLSSSVPGASVSMLEEMRQTLLRRQGGNAMAPCQLFVVVVVTHVRTTSARWSHGSLLVHATCRSYMCFEEATGRAACYL
jgi:hypothetical protein